MSAHKWLLQISDNPDETLYHISLLFKCIPRQGQCDLLFIVPKPPYPSLPMGKLKINNSFRTSKHKLWRLWDFHLRHYVLWHAVLFFINTDWELWLCFLYCRRGKCIFLHKMLFCCSSLQRYRVNKDLSCIISGSEMQYVCVLCQHLKHLRGLRRLWQTRLQDKVTLLGCLSWRKWPARTKQFRILLSFKLEHIEGLLCDWWNNGSHLSRSHRPFISHSCLISGAYIIILP